MHIIWQWVEYNMSELVSSTKWLNEKGRLDQRVNSIFMYFLEKNNNK